MAKPDIDKVARALGASRVVDVSATPATGPLDWLALAEQVHQRLRSTGGRPTDPERSVLRQVRFTPEHWQRLEQLALQWSTDDRKVSPAQVAAVLIERGLAALREPHGRAKATRA